jgi:hypothetical protein
MRYVGLVGFVIVGLLGGAGPAEADYVLTARGQYGGLGWSAPKRCKYNRTTLRGWLGIETIGPVVTGSNLRRGRIDRTWARYAVYLTDANNGYRTLATSGWSGWLRTKQGQARYWNLSGHAFTGDWRGNYGLDVRVEWYKGGRRVGVKAIRTTNFHYFSQYNTGPYGPLSSCAWQPQLTY